MGNMISWNWPNWITVVLMVGLGYLVLCLLSSLLGGKLGRRGNPAASGSGQSRSQRNFAGVYGQSEFALPAAA